MVQYVTITSFNYLKLNDRSSTNHHEYKQCSQNAIQSYKQENVRFDTAVIIDVTKCPQINKTKPNLIKPSSSISTLQYHPPYSDHINIDQPSTQLFPWSYNSNYTPKVNKMSRRIHYLTK